MQTLRLMNTTGQPNSDYQDSLSQKKAQMFLILKALPYAIHII